MYQCHIFGGAISFRLLCYLYFVLLSKPRSYIFVPFLTAECCNIKWKVLNSAVPSKFERKYKTALNKSELNVKG
jgi:hypothetical protein